MRWLKTLVAIWKGDLLKDELEKSRVAIDEARTTVENMRATLDGEDDDLFRRNGWMPGKTCDGK